MRSFGGGRGCSRRHCDTSENERARLHAAHLLPYRLSIASCNVESFSEKSGLFLKKSGLFLNIPAKSGLFQNIPEKSGLFLNIPVKSGISVKLFSDSLSEASGLV